MSGLTCATAPGVEFSSYDDLKQHYKTDWHRYNLKRKVAGLPMVSLDLFERVVNHATALQESAERPASTAHLKADKERRRPSTRRTRCVLN
jgi:pre-60S factor REI1